MTGTRYNPMQYTGTYLDESTGLYQMGARYYGAGLGRFTQVDPLPRSVLDLRLSHHWSGLVCLVIRCIQMLGGLFSVTLTWIGPNTSLLGFVGSRMALSCIGRPAPVEPAGAPSARASAWRDPAAVLHREWHYHQCGLCGLGRGRKRAGSPGTMMLGGSCNLPPTRCIGYFRMADDAALLRGHRLRRADRGAPVDRVRARPTGSVGAGTTLYVAPAPAMPAPLDARAHATEPRPYSARLIAQYSLLRGGV